MGDTAIELLVQTIGGKLPDPLEIVFPCGLDVRGSTKSIEEQVNS
jgi:DNA-binding LacI/PurR family transcriptional regulator